MVEFRLGLRARAGVPDRHSPDWCAFISAATAARRSPTRRGPFRFSCAGIHPREIVVTFHRTDPPTLVIEHEQRTFRMTARPSASGSRYVGTDGSFWDKGPEATATLGKGAPTVHCIRKR